jgi:transglutaminase-like putative cysteine protease
MTTVSPVARRIFMKNMAASGATAAFPAISFSQSAPEVPARQFNPQPGTWRTFEVTTRVDLTAATGGARVWLPVPSVDTDWQKSTPGSFTSNGAAEFRQDTGSGARMLFVAFADGQAQPFVELTSRVQTQNRANAWNMQGPAAAEPADLKAWLQPTSLLPTDGIVRKTALDATRGAASDVEKAQRIYDWIVANTFREPKVRGCGEGDIRTMLETGNLGGKCADLNALFVGLCRAAGLPARDVYGLRLAPSAFGYRELGGNSASLKGAQHCRAEVYLKGWGWVGMDPADVTKVMRQELPEWIKSPRHAIVAPVNKSLFGGWEGNWMAFNTAHDLSLPQSRGPRLGFLMYPVAETAAGRLDSYAPDDFKYQISAREIQV